MTKIKNEIKIAKEYFFNSKKASVLAYALIILAIMIAIVTSLSVATVLEKKSASSTDFSVQAFQTADSGAQLAIKRINANPNKTLGDTLLFGASCVSGVVNGSYDGLPPNTGTYDLLFYEADGAQIGDCTTTAGNIADIKSVGKFKDVVRAIKVSVADNYTKLLLHADELPPGSPFKDSSSSAKTVTSNGGVTQSAAQSKFGGESANFDGSDDYLSLADSNDWNFGAGDFTIDFWVRFNNAPSPSGFSLVGQMADSSNRWNSIVENTSGRYDYHLYFYSSGVLLGNYITTKPQTINLNTWYHLAFERTTTTAKLFINGVSEPLTENVAFGNNDVGDINGNLNIGNYNSGSWLNGYIDELRILKGIARWTSNFTPPTSAYN